jgi:hypothetical protein
MRNSYACAMLINFSDTTLTIPKSKIVGLAEEVDEGMVNKLNTRTRSTTTEVTKAPREKLNEALYSKCYPQ